MINQAGIISFKIGVRFTNQNAYEEFTDLDMHMNPDFSQNTFINRTFGIWTNRIIYIYGTNLNEVLHLDDYRVSITDQDCEMAELTSTYIRCILPTAIPLQDTGNYSSIRVHIGNLDPKVGQIWYRVATFANGGPNIPVLEYYPNDFSSRLLVNGEAVMVGLGVDDYEVRIGQEYANNIRVTPTSLSCRGPSVSPLPTSQFEQHRFNYPQLIIKVPKAPRENMETFFQYEYHAAYVRYMNHTYSLNAVVTQDTQGPGALNFDGNANGANSNNAQPTQIVIHRTEKESDGSSNDWTLWVILAICLAFGLFIVSLIFCCLCCPGWFVMRKMSEYDESRLVRESRSSSTHRSARLGQPWRVVAEYSSRGSGRRSYDYGAYF